MERQNIKIHCHQDLLPYLRSQWSLEEQVEIDSRPPTSSTHTRDTGNKKVRRLQDDVVLRVKRFLIFTGSGTVLSESTAKRESEPGLRVDPKLLVRILLILINVSSPFSEQENEVFPNSKAQRSEKSATFSSTSKREGKSEFLSTFDLEFLKYQCCVIRHDRLYFALLYQDIDDPSFKVLRKKNKNIRYLASYLCLYVMRHFFEHFTYANVRKVISLDLDSRLNTLMLPNHTASQPRNAWENLLSSKETFSELESPQSMTRRPTIEKLSSGFQRSGLLGRNQSPSGGGPLNIRDFNVFFNVNLINFCNSFLRSFKKVFSNINFDRKKTLIQMFVIDKESKSEIFRHSFISHTSKHIDFIRSDVMPFLISNIIENIEDYLIRKQDEMKGQKMEFEHYFLNKILKVIYLPSWRGIYLVFMVEAHLGITRFPNHITRQIDFRRHIERLRKDRYKCRKTYRVFVGEFKDPMAYEDFIWKYIAQALSVFDPTPDTNCFAIQNLRQHYESSLDRGAQTPSGVFTNARNSLYDLIQNLRTPPIGANSSAYESFFTMDNKTPKNMTRSASSLNFSDISRIQDKSLTPVGFFSGLKRPTPKKKYTIEHSDYGLQTEVKQKWSGVRTFADRVDESLQTIDPGKRVNSGHPSYTYQPVFGSPDQHHKVQSDLPEMFKDSGGKGPIVRREESKDDNQQGTEELVQSELMKHQRLEQKFINDETLNQGTEDNAQGQGGESQVRNYQQNQERDVSFSHTPLTAPAHSPGHLIDNNAIVKSN